jgi:hypothetical protein
MRSQPASFNKPHAWSLTEGYERDGGARHYCVDGRAGGEANRSAPSAIVEFW